MGLLLAALSIAVIALAVLLYRQVDAVKELRNAHVNLAAEVGVVRREAQIAINTLASNDSSCDREITDARDNAASNLKEATNFLQASDTANEAYAKSLNERLVLLEIEKTVAPKPVEEPPPARRSFASQKTRAEAGARKV